jgi:hypothetical protein
MIVSSAVFTPCGVNNKKSKANKPLLAVPNELLSFLMLYLELVSAPPPPASWGND